jgi:hypothetical protein
MRVQQWLLLCALALAVVGMHHVPLAPHTMSHDSAHTAAVMPTTATTPAELPEIHSPAGPASGAGHDLMHLCLAIMGAAGGFVLLAWLLMATGGAGLAPFGGPRVVAARLWRPPRRAGRSLLTSVCLLRI